MKNPDTTLDLKRSERAVVARLEEQVQEMLTDKQAAEQAKEDLRINALRHIQNIESSAERMQRKVTNEEAVFRSQFDAV